MPKNIFQTILNPASIAVVGASRSPQKVGYQVFNNLIEGGFTGKLYPINPNAKEILGHKVYPTLSALPHPPELIVIVTPAQLVSPLIGEADQLGVKAAIVITAGFSESGDAGADLQRQLKLQLQTTKIRILGPNCLGVLSTPNHLNATFGPPLPKQGSVLLISQSGALVTGVLDWVKKQGLGLSHAITLGNRLDIDETEALEFATTDPHTKLVMMYLESFHDAPRFFSLASRLTPHLPVLLLKGGQSAAGQSASASHTAALATNYTLVSAFARQAGLILSDTIQMWLTASAVMAVTPSFTGDRLGIITNAGGPGVLATDEAIAHHLNIVPFTAQTGRNLAARLHLEVCHNPLDLLGDASPEKFSESLAIVAADPNTDFILVIITPQTTTKPVTTARLLVQSAGRFKKPVFAVLLGGEKMTVPQRILEAGHIPTYTYPNEAILTIATKSWYEKHRRGFYFFPAQKPAILPPGVQPKLATLLLEPLTLKTAFTLLRAYQFHLPESRIITTENEVPEALAAVGRPAVMKTAGLHLAHKAKLGGVMLGLMTVYHSRMAFRKLKLLHPDVLIQQTIHGPIELIIGAKRDAQLGAFITVGLGGSLTDAIADRSYAFIPAQTNYLKYIFENTRAFKLLTEKHLPLEPVLDTMQRLSTMMLDFPRISETEINPAIITSNRVYACDIKITLLE